MKNPSKEADFSGSRVAALRDRQRRRERGPR